MAAKKKNHGTTLLGIALMRISLGLIMLWAFFDKLFGLGLATCRDAETDIVTQGCSKAWINGGSPTDGFLKFGSKGPLKDFYATLVGNEFIAILFMVGLLCIGAALLFGVGVRIAAVTGSLLFLMMWSAVLPPANHPFLDDHIVYIFALLVIAASNSNQVLGLGRWWSSIPFVKKNPFLQ